MITRDSFLFYLDAAHGINPRIGGDPVYSRASGATLRDHTTPPHARALIVNQPRIEPFSLRGGSRANGLHLESAKTNRVTYSEDFESWDSNGPAITPGYRDPFGGLNASIITATGVLYNSISHPVTLSGDGTKTPSIFVKPGPSLIAEMWIGLYDGTVSAWRHLVGLTWDADGVPTIEGGLDGTGEVFEPEPWADGWWRIAFNAAGVIAANANRMYIYPDDVASQNGYIFGAQVEDAAYPTSYIPTDGTQATRATDLVEWKHSGRVEPMAFYLRAASIRNPSYWGFGIGEPNVGGLDLGSYTAPHTFYAGYRTSPSDIYVIEQAAPTVHRDSETELVGIYRADGTMRLITSLDRAAPIASSVITLDGIPATPPALTDFFADSVVWAFFEDVHLFDLRMVKLGDLDNVPGTASDLAVMAELRRARLDASGHLV